MPSNRATAVQNLTSYRWVGNVCELQSVNEGGVVLAKGSVAEIDAEANRRRRSRSLDALENVERNYILRALNETR
jgi:DNA-binding NtrC family response regulator